MREGAIPPTGYGPQGCGVVYTRTRQRLSLRATFAPMPMSMPARVKRKRARLFTQSELATVLGCSRSTVQRIESDPLPGELVAYLNAVGYVVAFYPRRKGKG